MKIHKLLMTALIIAIFELLSFATIINIPADYPTIQQGINASANGDTVLVSPGEYMEAVEIIGKNIILASLFLTTGDPFYIDSTIIFNGLDRSLRRVSFDSVESSDAAVIGFTIDGGYSWSYAEGGVSCSNNSNPLIAYNKIVSCYAEVGSGIHCYRSNPKIYKNYFCHNHAGMLFQGDGGAMRLISSNPEIIGNIFLTCSANRNGGVVYCSDSNPLVQNNIFCDSEADSGGAFYLENSCPRLINNVFFNNRADSGFGGAIFCTGISNPLIVNNIMRAGSALEGIEIYADYSSSPVVNHSNIAGNWPGEGNIDIEPLFRDPDDGDFHLMAIACGDPYDSPCIDMGKTTIIDSLIDCHWGLGTERSDMGAYSGGGGTVDIDELVNNLPVRVSFSQNYPNPFNISTLIKYELPIQSPVTIDIYDILGRKVTTLQNALQPVGYYQLMWNAGDLSSGVYFYKLQAGDYIETRKMMLVK